MPSHSTLVAGARAGAAGDPGDPGDPADGRLGRPALLGAAGSVLLALASDLPGSPFGPGAAGLWPLAVSGPVPGWEGPAVPGWAGLSDQGPGVAAGHLLSTAAVLAGMALLGAAWVLAWRTVRARPATGLGGLGAMVGAWVAPLFLAAPFATQDVWTYGAEGNLVLHGVGGYRSASFLGQSVWAAGVDGHAVRASPYGPGALDLSAFFVKVSGGHPWIAAQWWRITAVIGLVLCAWGVARIVSLAGGNTTASVLAGVANPAVLVILVGGIQNDALMLGLAVAGVALALSGTRWWGILLCSLAVAVKPTALLALAALAWWAFGSTWRRRATGILAAAAVQGAVLVVAGLGVGGGFGWLRALSADEGFPGPWSLGPRFFGLHAHWATAAIATAGLVLAAALLIGYRRRAGGIVGLGCALAVVALTSPRPEPWYLAWALVFVACGGLTRRSERVGMAVLSAMMLGSLLPAGPLWWFSGVIVITWLGIIWLKANLSPTGAAPPAAATVAVP